MPLLQFRKGDGMAGFINIAIVAGAKPFARRLGPLHERSRKMPNASFFDFFFITTTVALLYLSSKWLRYSFHHYYGTQKRFAFGQIPVTFYNNRNAVRQKSGKTPLTNSPKNLWRCSLVDIQFSFPYWRGADPVPLVCRPLIPISGNRQVVNGGAFYAPFILTS